MHTTAPTAPSAVLSVRPRHGGWRTGAAASLVASAVSELRAGRSPHRDIAALAQLGGGERPSGLAAAEELDRRLGAAVVHLADDLRLLGARATAFDGPTRAAAPPGVAFTDDDSDTVLTTLFHHLQPEALVGYPHPGEWVASSVDVVPCAVHGYEDGPVDCLRRSVRAHLAVMVGLAAGAPPTTGDVTSAEQVRLAADAAHDGSAHDDSVGGDPVLRALWTGVATLAAWRAFSATH